MRMTRAQRVAVSVQIEARASNLAKLMFILETNNPLSIGMTLAEYYKSPHGVHAWRKRAKLLLAAIKGELSPGQMRAIGLLRIP